MSQIGIENLVLESEFDPANPLDEEHSWIAIALDHVEDAWVRNVTARHFVASAIRVGHRARRITIENCRSEKPVSEIAGYRRQSFLVEGQQVLVRQCRSEQGMNDFAVGLLAAGPNVFLDCTATGALGPSGSFESWASGVLYERVRIEAPASASPTTARVHKAPDGLRRIRSCGIARPRRSSRTVPKALRIRQTVERSRFTKRSC